MPGSGRRSAFQPFRRARWAPRRDNRSGCCAAKFSTPGSRSAAHRRQTADIRRRGWRGSAHRPARCVGKGAQGHFRRLNADPRGRRGAPCHRPHASTSPRCSGRPSSPPKPPRRASCASPAPAGHQCPRPRRDSRARRDGESAVPAAGLYVPRSPTTPVALRRQALPGSRRR